MPMRRRLMRPSAWQAVSVMRRAPWPSRSICAHRSSSSARRIGGSPSRARHGSAKLRRASNTGGSRAGKSARPSARAPDRAGSARFRSGRCSGSGGRGSRAGAAGHRRWCAGRDGATARQGWGSSRSASTGRSRSMVKPLARRGDALLHRAGRAVARQRPGRAGRSGRAHAVREAQLGEIGGDPAQHRHLAAEQMRRAGDVEPQPVRAVDIRPRRVAHAPARQVVQRAAVALRLAPGAC